MHQKHRTKHVIKHPFRPSINQVSRTLFLSPPSFRPPRSLPFPPLNPFPLTPHPHTHRRRLTSPSPVPSPPPSTALCGAVCGVVWCCVQ